MQPITLKIDDETLCEKNFTKYLGIYFDKHLSWKKQIEYVKQRISRGIGILYKLRHMIPQHLLKNIYYALLYPYITYGIINWGCAYKSNLDPVEKAMKKIVRIMTHSDMQEHSLPLFKKLDLMNFSQLLLFERLKITWKAHNSVLPISLCKIFPNAYSDNNNSRRRNFSQNYNPICKTSYKSRFITSVGSIAWRDLPKSLKEINHLPLFIGKIKKYCKEIT